MVGRRYQRLRPRIMAVTMSLIVGPQSLHRPELQLNTCHESSTVIQWQHCVKTYPRSTGHIMGPGPWLEAAIDLSASPNVGSQCTR